MTAENLISGDCLFYRGKPMRLMHRVSPAVWRVEPIFVNDTTAYDQTFDLHDAVTLLHGTRSLDI